MSASSVAGEGANPPRRASTVNDAAPSRGQDGIERRVAGILLLLLAIGCLLILRPFLSALLWAAILAASTWPVYARLERLLGGRRSAAAALMVVSAAAVFLLPLTLLASHLAGEVTGAATVASRWMESGPPGPPDWVRTLPLVGARLDAYWQSVANDSAKLVADLRAYIGPAREWLLSAAVSLGAGMTELVLALLISFFFYRDGMAGVVALRSALGRVGGANAEQLLGLAGTTITGVVYGILGTNLVEAMLAGLGLRTAGVPGALFLSFVLFFLTLIPMAPLLVFFPAILWLVQQGATGAAIFLSVWYVLVFVLLEGILRAYLIGRGGELPLLLVFLGILGGIATFGLLGVFLGPTLLAVGYALLRAWNAAEGERAEATDGGREAHWGSGGDGHLGHAGRHDQ
jgi:predicted PurR-regulated permease PerM